MNALSVDSCRSDAGFRPVGGVGQKYGTEDELAPLPSASFTCLTSLLNRIESETHSGRYGERQRTFGRCAMYELPLVFLRSLRGAVRRIYSAADWRRRNGAECAAAMVYFSVMCLLVWVSLSAPSVGRPLRWRECGKRASDIRRW
ncbi:hypothetical protein KCP74_02875 [Salmonella enterica subsp. enterica]|nr:hypothetical protein KCP74_02875 [Salmonella enterica subsp. enterica]